MPREKTPGLDGATRSGEPPLSGAAAGRGVPEPAVGRLAGAAFTSDLSVAELAAVRLAGFEPCGLVMGSSVYHVASQAGSGALGVVGPVGEQTAYPCPHGGFHEGARTGYTWERLGEERGLLEARDLALGRLEDEAGLLGAHGVAGVRLDIRRLEGTVGTVEFRLVGTALRRAGRPPPSRPFTSHLSGQDLLKLLQHGLAPVGLVMGVAVVEVDPGCGTEWLEASYGSVELPQLTDAADRCRALAVAHLEREAAALGDGVVGVDAAFRIHEGPGRFVFELVATGTAVRAFDPGAALLPPRIVLPLRDRR
jgi:uncharacterized protein YbjQ (UPF0145 family)